MGFFNEYPYTNLHEVNLDHVLKSISDLKNDFLNFKVSNTLQYYGNWNISKSYPKNVIVMDGNNGYVSLKVVPSGIDITNQSYWQMIADYTAIVGDLNQRVDKNTSDIEKNTSELNAKIDKNTSDLNAKIDKNTSDIEKNTSDIEKLSSGLNIYIGDSYGVGEPYDENLGWCYKVPGLIGDDNYITMCQGGYGFATNGKKFIDLFKQNENLITDADNVRNVYVMGGFNDASYSYSDITGAINEFCMYVKSKYKNATVYISCIAWGYDESVRANISNIVQVAYSDCAKFNGIYLSGCEFVLHNYTLLNDDRIHPNRDGYNKLNSCISSMIKGRIVPFYTYNNTPIEAYGISKTVVNANVCELWNNNFVTISGTTASNILFNFDNITMNGDSIIDIGKMNLKFARPFLNGYINNQHFIGYISSNTGFHKFIGVVGIGPDGVLYVRNLTLKDDGAYVTFNNVSQLSFPFPEFIYPINYS